MDFVMFSPPQYWLWDPLRLLPNNAEINLIVKLTTHLDQVARFTLRYSPILPYGIMVI
jgi:hypothetical protein